MKRKSLLIMLLVALFVPLAMNAQDGTLKKCRARSARPELESNTMMTSSNDKGNRDASYEKVTSAQSDWSGNYLLAASTTSTNVEVFNGTVYNNVYTLNSSTSTYTSVGSFEYLTQSNNVISSITGSDGDGAILTIAPVTASGYTSYYTIRINGGDYLGSTTTGGMITNSSANSTAYYWNISYNTNTSSVYLYSASTNSSTYRICYFVEDDGSNTYGGFCSNQIYYSGSSFDYDAVTLYKETTSGGGDNYIWVETTTITPNEEFLIGFVNNGNVYLAVNYAANESNHYYTSAESSTYFGYTAQATFDGNGHVTGVSGYATDLQYCTWKFSTTTGGTIQSGYQSGYYLRTYSSTSYADLYPASGTSNGTGWTYSSGKLYRTISNTNRYAEYYYVSNGPHMRMTSTNPSSANVKLYTKQIVVNTCPAPTNLTVNDITNNSAVISWDGSASSYEMEYIKSGSVYNFDDGSLQGWSNLKVNSGGGEWISSDNNGGGYDYTTQAHSGECFAMSYSYVDGGAGAYNTNVYLVSPQRYEITSSSASLNFFYAWANSTYNDYLEVCVSTATTPTANSFTSIWNNGGSQGSTKSGKERHQKNRATWNEVTLPLSAYNGQSIWIAFHHKANDMYEIWIDDVTVSTGNNSWIPAPEPITSPYLLEGLDSETLYSVRVKAICGGDDGESAWSTVSFTTDSPCDTPVGLSTTNITAASATLNWDGYQDSYSVKYGRLFFNDNFDDSHASGWTNGGSVYSWQGTTNYFVMLGMASSGTQYLITPELSDLVGGNILEFSQNYYEGPMTFYVGYSSTTNSTSAFTWGSEISASAAAISYTETIPTGTKYIAIKTTATNSSYGLVIDDFRIYSQTVTPSNGNTLPINGLEPNSEYYWLVQGVNCDGNGGTTRWSEEAYFTTLDGTLVTSITASDVTVAVGATATITPTVLPADATNSAVTYTSGDDAIATVNASGVVTGVAAGNTTITIAATDGSGVTATINVTVTSVDVTGITTSDVTVVNGQTATISYTVAPNNATDPSVTFTSADVTIATVDASGVVTGVSVGTTTITIASVSNPEVTATVNVTVTSNPNAVQFTVEAPANAHPGDVITVSGVLTAPTSGTYSGFTDLLMAINYDHNAFEFVNGSIVYGPVVAQAQQYNSQITNFTNVTDKIQVSINCYQEGYYVTAQGVVFSAQFTVLAETGSFTFTGEPNGYQNFDHEIEGGGGIEYILYEATPSTVEITGPETYEKEIIGWTSDSNGWYLISSPIGIVNPTDANKTNMVTENYDLYTFDQTHEDEWVNYKQSGNFAQLEPGKGYLYAHSSTFMLTFTGYAYTGTGTFDLVYDTSNPDSFMHGWNLMGNPFGVPASVSRPYYTLNYNFEYAAVSEGQSVEAMEGVFVHLETSETNPTVTFTPTSQSTDEGGKSSSLTLNITKDGKFVDRAIVCFSQGLTLPKFQFNRNHTKVYIPQDGQDYALVRSEEMGEMPVNFKAENNGTYSLNFSSKNTEFAYLHLIDNMTGKDIDLLQTQSYSFEARTTDYESRFKLVFATGNNSKDDNFAFFSNGSFIINNEGEATLQVIDVTGRILKSASINGCTNVNVNAASGVYMLRLINGDSVKVQKVVVK